MTHRSPWGSVRRLPSGRYQARYRVDGVVHTAPRTFRTRRDADAFLARTRADLERGAWADPDAGNVPLAEYAWRWLDERPNLRPRTQECASSRQHAVARRSASLGRGMLVSAVLVEA